MLKMPGQDYTLRLADENDADTVYAIMCDAAQWLQSRGIEQWGWTLTEGGRSYVLARVASGQAYLVFAEDGQAAGTFTLQWDDPKIWGETRGKDGLAGYVHGLAVFRSHAGRGLGAIMLDHAEQIIRAHDRKLLRLDCMAANSDLVNYYLRIGLRDAGSSDASGWAARLFERAIDSA